MSNIKYFAHIDGLRAVAVLSVIIFHINPLWLPGGFVGVDIFFVISGFLITSILVKEASNQTLSFKSFYLRRVKRILPAFFFVTITTLIVGYFLFLPDDFKYLARSARSNLYFGSNFHFMSIGDYFAPSMSEMPLLHTWSLAVEEQFYFAWPLTLLILSKKPKNILVYFITLAIITSVSLSYYFSAHIEYSAISYFSPISRVAELLIGALLAVLTYEKNFSPPKNNILPIILPVTGYSLLIYSFINITKDSQFPGYQILFPSIGSALLIFTGLYTPLKKNPLLFPLTNKTMVFIGLLSYSLYLWHWPILAYTRYIIIDNKLPLIAICIAMTLTIILSLISYYGVEKTFQKKHYTFKKAVICFYVLPTIFILVFTFWVKSNNWGTFQLNKDSAGRKQFDQVCQKTQYSNCLLGSKSTKPSIIITGDSHAKHLRKIIDLMGKDQSWSALILASPSCYTFNNLNVNRLKTKKHFQESCSQLINNQLATTSNFDTLVLAQKWNTYLSPQLATEKDIQYFKELLEESINAYSLAGKNIILVSQIPQYEKPVKRFTLFNFAEDNAIIPELHEPINIYLKSLSDSSDNVFYWDIASPTTDFKNGIFNGDSLYYDDNHLSYRGSIEVYSKLKHKPTPFNLITHGNQD